MPRCVLICCDKRAFWWCSAAIRSEYTRWAMRGADRVRSHDAPGNPTAETNMKHRSAASQSNTWRARRPASWSLTAAETQIVRALAAGRKPGEIAAARGVSVHTIRTHLKRAMAKARVHSQIALVARVLSAS